MHALGWFGRRPGCRRWSARAARAVFLAGVAATLTLGSGAAVAQATDEPGHPVKTLAKSCDLRFMPTKPTVTGPSILGNAFAVCDIPPDRTCSPSAVVDTLGATRAVGVFVVDQLDAPAPACARDRESSPSRLVATQASTSC